MSHSCTVINVSLFSAVALLLFAALFVVNYHKTQLSNGNSEMSLFDYFKSSPLHENLRILEPNDVRDLDCVLTTTKPAFKACLMDKKISMESKDMYLYGDQTHSHEYSLWLHMARAWRFYQKATFIDGGANIGFYATLAAAMGLDVIAIEPVALIAQCIQKNMVVNRLSGKITLLNNALSNSRTTVSLNPSYGDLLGSVEVMRPRSRRTKVLAEARTIFLDDVIPLVRTKTVIIKLDIQGYECKALDRAKQLMRNFYVPYVFLEWYELVGNKNKPNSPCDSRLLNRTIAFFRANGYVPYWFSNVDKVMDEQRLHSKPTVINMFWKHKDSIILE